MKYENVGIVHAEPSETDDIVRTILDDSGIDHRLGPIERFLEDPPAVLIAIGDSAMIDIGKVGTSITAPVIPIHCNLGFRPVPLDDLEHIVQPAHKRISTSMVEHHVVAVTVDAEQVGSAIMDISLMTAEPARISEFAIRIDGRVLDTIRADGVVLATPAGSTGYSAAAGGSVIMPGLPVTTLVPVAPFRTRWSTWIVNPETVELQAIRDEGELLLRLDDRQERIVEPHESIRFSVERTIETLAIDDRANPQ